MSLDDALQRHQQTRQSDRILPADHVKLQKIDALMGVGNKYEALGHLSKDQIWCLSVYRAFNEHLIAGGVEGGIEPVIHLMENYLHLSPSIDRMGRQEAVTVLKISPRYSEPWGLQAELQPKPSFWEKLLNSRRPEGGER